MRLSSSSTLSVGAIQLPRLGSCPRVGAALPAAACWVRFCKKSKPGTNLPKSGKLGVLALLMGVSWRFFVLMDGLCGLQGPKAAAYLAWIVLRTGITSTTFCRCARGLYCSATTFCSMAPNTDCPFLPFISMRIVSPSFMKRVLALPSASVSRARFSAMQL